MEITVLVHGIPIIAKVIRADYLPPAPKDRKLWDSPDDAGGWEIEYEVFDSEGNPASWLENIDVTDQIIEHLK